PSNIGATTLFATHYLEVTELEGKLYGANNYCIAVKESGEDIVFLRKIIKGGADKSYGIQVARLAGVPKKVIDRALEIAKTLNEQEITNRARMLAESAGETAVSEESKKVSKGGGHRRQGEKKQEGYEQLSFFQQEKCPCQDISPSPSGQSQQNRIIGELQALELANMTPLAALNKLYELQALINKS
ncbi:MAG: DNA mismatch repair protein MutS, partial [Lachnospiraceae bacterium]|nr:DNA mismatch repair protein MutS [Lachnospiraceae bacterium]